MDLSELAAGRRVVVVAGPGGVGKTTLSAALALQLARQGQNVALITIDPALRLADALGIEYRGNELRPVALPWPEAGGLSALMLEVRSTFDRLIRRHARNEEQFRTIAGNRFYRHFSNAVGGSVEYMAGERLYEVVSEGGFDLVVLDTPPSERAVDFLEAPGRLMAALDESVFHWAVKPYLAAGRLGAQLVSLGGAYILRVLSRVAGGELIDSLAEFLGAFHDLFPGFRERAAAVEAILRDPATGFLVVTTADEDRLVEALHFRRLIEERGLSFAAFVVNRVTPFEACPLVDGHDDGPDRLAARLARLHGREFDRAMISACLGARAREGMRHARERWGIDLLRRETGPGQRIVAVPAAGVPVTGLTRLAELAQTARPV